MLRRLRLHVGLSALFVPVVLATGLFIAISSYQRTTTLLLEANARLMRTTARATDLEMEKALKVEFIQRKITDLQGLSAEPNLEARLPFLPLMARGLARTPLVTSYYVGYANGDRFQLRRLWDDVDRTIFKAPAEAEYALQSNEKAAGVAGSKVLLFDGNLKLIRTSVVPEFAGFDPRTRPWFRQAIATPDPIVTDIYRFAATGRPGITVARRSQDGKAVVGADVRISTLSDLLASNRVTAGTQLALVDGNGGLLALNDMTKMERPGISANRSMVPLLLGVDVPILSSLSENLTSLIASLAANREVVERAVTLNGVHWNVAVAKAAKISDLQTYLVMAVPSDELLAGAKTLRRDSILSTLLVILIALPVVILIARRVTRALRQLSVEAEAVRNFEFDNPVAVRSIVREVDDLALTIDAMKTTIRRFLSISSAIAAEPNFERLLERILSESIINTQAAGGVLFLASERGTRLTPAQAQGADQQPIPLALPPLPTGGIARVLQQAEGKDQVLTGSLHPGGSTLEKKLAGALGLDGAPYLAVPLANRERELLGLLVFWFDTAPDTARISFTRAFSSTAAVTLETRELIRAQKALFEAFIELIASSIDAKSPYTGGHCYRVPEITKMLAAAAVETKEGPFADFSLDEGQWEAVHVAAWLHDCGKVTTPEFVVDKATKLETIYDRIHEVRMRFEVLKREAELTYWRQVAAGGNAKALAAVRDAELRQLDDDFAFVAECNQGGEFMAPERIERLKAIAARTWTRTLDDRLGVSTEELLRKEREPAVPVPAVESLLADKPEHRIERPPGTEISPDNPWGFKVDTPELLYNRGEVYNLSVARGTLSAEERFKINEHIIQTIRMLSALPFPRHMSQVAEIAGGHHETMIGTGYPKRLKKEEMSEVARMMAIADIFEALTAVDRPYKKGKTLSQALKIMTFMKKDQHIDPDLFALFIRSGVYKRYAEKYLKPDQIDEVDEEAVLSA